MWVGGPRGRVGASKRTGHFAAKTLVVSFLSYTADETVASIIPSTVLNGGLFRQIFVMRHIIASFTQRNARQPSLLDLCARNPRE